VGRRAPWSAGEARLGGGRQRTDALVPFTDSLTRAHRKAIADFQSANRMPGVFEFGDLAGLPAQLEDLDGRSRAVEQWEMTGSPHASTSGRSCWPVNRCGRGR